MLKALVSFVVDILRAFFPPARPSPVERQIQRKSFSAGVLRADDLLVLRLDFYNLRLQPAAGGRQAVPEGPGDSFVVVHFPPQHVAERAFLEAAGGKPGEPILPPPVAARLAGESRLVFHLNPALLPLEFTLESLLAALSRSAPLVSDRVTPVPGTPPVGGTAEFGGDRSPFTAIEAPWRLVLSPHPETRWAHSPQPVTLPVAGGGTRTELWHTRLGTRPASGTEVDETSAARRTARAVFSVDYRGTSTPWLDQDLSPFRSSLRRYDRHFLVQLTAERDRVGNAPFAVERLMLTSLGAWLQAHGTWDAPGVGLTEWRHRSTLGRDQFVQVVQKGFLFPCGNRAVTIITTERKVEIGTGGHLEGRPVAYLRQRVQIFVREPVKRFGHRAFPFRTIEFKTRLTPNLIHPADDTIPLASVGEATFWPRYLDGGVGGIGGIAQDVLFQIEGTDWDGQVTSFSARQIFVPETADQGPDIGKLVAAYNGVAGGFDPVPESPRRTVPTGGQKIAFAPSLEPGDTTLETDKLVLAALNATGSPHFLPALRGFQVDIPAVRQIAKGGAPSLLRFDDGFLKAPATQFGNAGEVFARIDAPAGIRFPVEKTGGLVAPDFTPQGISRTFGPVGDVATFASGQFDPGKIFAGVKILGGIPLDKIFKQIPFGWPSQAGETVPGLTTVRETVEIGGVPTEVIQTRYAWTARRDQLQGQPIFAPEAGALFQLDSVIDTPLDGTEPRFKIEGKLEKFEIVLPPGADALIGARFDHVRFRAATGEKVDVSVQFDDLVFKGDLTFVNDIRKYIPLDGFVDPPYLDVNASGVNAGFSLGIPTIGIGIFSLQDVRLSAGFHLPFVGGTAALRFAFCERDHPFLLTVSLFGGGGFFALDLDTEKVTNVEASLEFGAAIALNLGVAAGKASITAGVYYQKSGAGFQITAFFRAAGALSVLGIISVSVELYVGLSYQSANCKLYGTATVKVKIKIVFFSVSVSLSIEREFAGSDPTFAQMLTPADWAEYCDAFAAEAA